MTQEVLLYTKGSYSL